MSDARELLRRTAEIAAAYVDSLDERPVFPKVEPEELRKALGGPLPEEPLPDEQVVEELAHAAEPGLVAMGSGRYFGFVIGGALPAALAADWLASAWDQNAGLYVGGPSASVVEQVVREWVVELLGLPADSSIGFVTGTQMAHVTGLAAARWHVLDAAGWDVNARGLTEAPRVRVIAGEKRHATVDRALRLLGLGAPELVAADAQGRLVPESLREALGSGRGPTIVCAQAGEVNTGAFDPLPEIADLCEAAGAWLHVDGAFGIWAAVSPRAAPSRRGPRARGLVDDGRAQVAQRSLRLRDRPLPPPRGAPRGDDHERLVPDPGRGRAAGARPGRLGARVLAAGARIRRLRGAALARPAAGSWSSSSAAARPPRASPSGSARSMASRC